jgi:uncharacterized radical SAM superfamily Fe-S cluster-containing enzyme
VGRDQDDAGQRHHAEAEAADVGAVLGRRADDVALLPRRVRYAKKVGYNSVQAATNGIEFAKSKEFAQGRPSRRVCATRTSSSTASANAANSHRLVGNLFDVKLRAIENLWSAGVDIVPVITIVNGINNEQVGRVVQFALDNPKKINFLSFQPVSFTGRDEEVTPNVARRSGTRCRIWRTT